MISDFAGLLRALSGGGVEFMVIGGVAGNILGAARGTFDLDLVYRRTPENIARLVVAMKPLKPYLRGAPDGLPFRFDEKTIRAGLNFTLTTIYGPLDLLGEVAGGGTYEALVDRTIEGQAFGVPVRCVNLDTLIHLKRAAGRPKDLEAIAELEKLRLAGAD